MKAKVKLMMEILDIRIVRAVCISSKRLRKVKVKSMIEVLDTKIVRGMSKSLKLTNRKLKERESQVFRSRDLKKRREVCSI